jgi:phosphatidate cytidylyltransferase
VTNLHQRLLLFFVGLPLLIAFFFFLPGWHHAAAASVVTLFGIGCSLELAKILTARGMTVSRLAFALIGGGFPVIAYLGVLTGDALGSFSGIGLVGIAAGIGTAAVLTPFAFAKSSDISDILSRAGAYALDIGYIGVLSAILALVSCEPSHATESLFTFLLIVLSNDTLAWFFGNLLGRKRGIIAVSPNKSVAGFLGGMAGSVCAAHGAALIYPDAIRAGPLETTILGAIIGDLVESALKRSAGVKDSGNLIPGRGGFLDTLDSLLISAPFFYGLSLAMGLFA